MKNRKAFRVGAIIWAGVSLLVCGAVHFLVAPQVDGAAGAILGQGFVLSQGALMRFLAVVEVLAGAWVLIRPRVNSGVVAALIGAVGLSLIPRFSQAPAIPIGAFELDARIVIIFMQVVAVVCGLAVAFFWMTRARRNG